MKLHILFLTIIVFIIGSAAPAFAQTTMTVTPVWRPGQQLTTLDVNNNGTADPGDYRYVDVDLLVTGNIQFWAVNMACVFTPAVLEGYNLGSVIGDDGDDVPMVTWGPEWGTLNQDFIPVSASTNPNGVFDFDAASGKLTLRATRLGNVSPMGINGASYTMLLATLRLRVRDLGSTFRTASATVKCTPMDFLDRDGRVVVKGKQSTTPALAVRTGYSISGQALLQGGKNHAGIQVACNRLVGPLVTPYTATTNSAGSYSFGSSGALIRETGTFRCVYTSPINSPQSKFLEAEIDLALNASTFFLLPVVLKGGNVDSTTAGSENAIDDFDLALFTSSWSPGPVSPAYSGLDVNGDGKVDEADLAMFAGNYGLGPDVDASHVLYGLATDYGGTFPNSRIYWGDPQAGPVQRLEDPKADRDFWPAMSPDGSKVAFSRFISKTGKYVLYTTPTAKPKAVQLTPKTGFTADALAPSWSPDGQRVAFVCSDKGQTSGYEFNQGNLCVMNADGTGLQQVVAGVKIYPPAWYDNNAILYAGTANHPNVGCQRNLCVIDLASGASGQVMAGLLADGDDVADMPGIASLLSGAKVLFYRFDNGSANSLRAQLILSYVSANGTFTTDSPVTVAIPSGGNAIDFYDVSPSADVMYYESTVSSGVFRTLDGFTNLTYTESLPLSADDWTHTGTHRVDGFVGNITSTGGSIPGGIWNGSSSIPTPYHAQRATFDWVP